MKEGIEVVAFDAYGTLFDVHSAARKLAPKLGEHADALSAIWRTKQLEYTWLRALMKRYVDFWTVTSEALDYAMAAVKIDDPSLRDELLSLYERIDAYDEVPEVLDALKAQGVRTAILSNGSPAMLETAAAHAGLTERLDAILSVDPIATYKPDPPVYDLPGERFGVEKSKVAFCTANAWDAAGASTAGLTVYWVNRFGQPPERLPQLVAGELSALRDLL
ncbi:MAG: haloacid dehalogenase type II [Deltaproteobacteria bacterium]|jgi:2-haloacid dehalogenase